MANSITPKSDGSLVVAVDPFYILTQPASLPDDRGQPKLTGYSIANLLVCMAQQVVGAKAPQLYTSTIRPMTAVTVKFDRNQFVIEFSKMEEMVKEAPAETPVRTPAEMKDDVRKQYEQYAMQKGLVPNASAH